MPAPEPKPQRYETLRYPYCYLWNIASAKRSVHIPTVPPTIQITSNICWLCVIQPLNILALNGVFHSNTTTSGHHYGTCNIEILSSKNDVPTQLDQRLPLKSYNPCSAKAWNFCGWDNCEDFHRLFTASFNPLRLSWQYLPLAHGRSSIPLPRSFRPASWSDRFLRYRSISYVQSSVTWKSVLQD